MGVISADGGEGRSERSDRLVNVSGGVAWRTSVPTGSLGVRSIRIGGTWYIPYLVAISGTDWGFKYHLRVTAHDTAIMGASQGSTEILTVSTTAAGLWTLRIDGTVVATSVTSASLNVWQAVTIKVDHQTGGTVTVRVGGVNAIVYTLLAGDITDMGGVPTSVWLQRTGGVVDVDDMVTVDGADGTDIWDFTDATVFLDPRTSNGTYTEGTGDYQDIDEVPWSNSDGVVFTSPGKADFGGDVVPTDYRLVAVAVTAGVLRTGTTAGENIRVFSDEGITPRYSSTVAAPADGVVGWIFDTATDDTAWTTPHYAATTFGFEVLT